MIGPKTTIRGALSGEENLLVEGKIEGSVRLEADLTVTQEANLNANVEAHTVEVEGTITGNIEAQKHLVVEKGATVVGDVSAPRLYIADGAHFKGKVSMDFDIPSASN